GLRAEQLGDLRRREVAAVAERDQLAVAVAQLGERAGEHHPPDGLLLEVAAVGRLHRLVVLPRPRQEVVGAPARDAEQPCDGRPLAPVEAPPVPERTLEHLAGHVLGVRPVAEAVLGVGVHLPDQRLGVGEGVAVQEAPHHPPGFRRGSRGLSRDAWASAWRRAAPLDASASSYQSVQSRRSFAIALRKLTRAAARSPSIACASASLRHGSGDQGMKPIASCACASARAKWPPSVDFELAETALFPSSPITANARTAATAPRPPILTGRRSRLGPSWDRPAARRVIAQNRPVSVTAGISQSQSAAAWSRKATNPAHANAAQGEERARLRAASGEPTTARSSARPSGPSSASVSTYRLCASWTFRPMRRFWAQN